MFYNALHLIVILKESIDKVTLYTCVGHNYWYLSFSFTKFIYSPIELDSYNKRHQEKVLTYSSMSGETAFEGRKVFDFWKRSFSVDKMVYGETRRFVMVEQDENSFKVI